MGQCDRHGLTFTQRQEASGFTVKAKHLARMDVDIPAMQRDLATRDAGCHGRMGPQVRKLRHDIFQRHVAQLFRVGEIVGIAFAADLLRRVTMPQPRGDVGREVRSALVDSAFIAPQSL